MKTIFKKSHLPFLRSIMHSRVGRDYWTLTRTMQEQDGLQNQLPAEIALLQQGAQLGDAWSMCELARTYFYNCGDTFLPLALSMWNKAILQKDQGAIFDMQHLPIHDRILGYRSPDGDRYKEIEMICAMLTQWYLSDLGLTPWESLDITEKSARIRALADEACCVMEVPQVAVNLIPGLSFNGKTVDGLAYWEGRVDIRAEALTDQVRTVEILFHELGHIVTFEIQKGNQRLKQIYGITDARIASWERQDMGYEVVTTEEDPDTLSYGVSTLWATFFPGN